MDLATVDKLLTTTRSVRKRLDLSRPVEPEIIEKCIEIAIQAPSGSNQQGWHFVIVTDSVKKAAIADCYRRAWNIYTNDPNRPTITEEDPRFEQMPRIVDSATYLVEHMQEVPILLIVCVEGRFETAPQVMQASYYGSILPAAWSLMLALRGPRNRRRLDDAPSYVRTGNRAPAGHPTHGHAGRAASRGVFHRIRFRTGEAPPAA